MAEPLVVRTPHKLSKEEALLGKTAVSKASSSFTMLAVEQGTWRVRAEFPRSRPSGTISAN